MRLRDATTRVGAGSVVLAAGCAEFHFAFGILLCAFVTWGCALHSRDPRAASESELRELARRMSRAIYLMLYSALLLKLAVQLTSLSWHESVVVLNWSPRFRAAPEHAFAECGERFRSELLWGIVALCLMRALLFRRNIPQPLPMLEARS